MSPMGPSVDNGYRGSRGNAIRGDAQTKGVFGTHWFGDMDQLMFSTKKK